MTLVILQPAQPSWQTVISLTYFLTNPLSHWTVYTWTKVNITSLQLPCLVSTEAWDVAHRKYWLLRTDELLRRTAEVIQGHGGYIKYGLNKE